MTDFTITVDNELDLAGITAAREKYVASLPETIDDPDNAGKQIPHPDLGMDDAGYVQMVMARAAQSYRIQHADRVAKIVAPTEAAAVEAAKAAVEAVVDAKKPREIKGGGVEVGAVGP